MGQGLGAVLPVVVVRVVADLLVQLLLTVEIVGLTVVTGGFRGGLSRHGKPGAGAILEQLLRFGRQEPQPSPEEQRHRKDREQQQGQHKPQFLVHRIRSLSARLMLTDAPCP